MDAEEFRDRMAGLLFLDRDDLPGLDLILWRKFCDDPLRFFVRCDDLCRAMIWDALEKKRGDTRPCQMTASEI